MVESFYGSHEFEDLMSRSDPTPSGRVHLIDLAVELQLSEADLGRYAYEFLSDRDFDINGMTVTDEGAEVLRCWLSREV